MPVPSAFRRQLSPIMESLLAGLVGLIIGALIMLAFGIIFIFFIFIFYFLFNFALLSFINEILGHTLKLSVLLAEMYINIGLL